jgi:hypothetical protein
MARLNPSAIGSTLTQAFSNLSNAAGNVINDTRNIDAIPAPQVPQAPAVTNDQIDRIVEERAQSLANQLIQAQALQSQLIKSSGRVFTRFDIANDVIENQKTVITRGLFGGEASMSIVYSSSIQSSAQKQYYYEAKDAVDGTTYFSVAYGHRLGSGSSAAGTNNDSPNRAVYSQYRLLLLEPGDTAFTFASGITSDQIYVVNLNRSALKEKLDPGNWQLSLARLSGSFFANNVHTGSNVKVAAGSGPGAGLITLIDDSNDTLEALSGNSGAVYNIVSGSITNGIFNPSSPRYYGLVYPDLGILVLDGTMLNASASFNSVTGSDIAGDNAFKLFTAISGAFNTARSNGNDGYEAFNARNAETISSTHYFVRVKNGEYNFSNNPTFTTGSLGEFSQPTFVGDPKTYLTTVGMYNDRQELLAVAKLSQPVQKSFEKEALIKVKLDF